MVGHDVRQPLALILGHLEVLADTWQDFPQDANIARVEKALGAAGRLMVLLAAVSVGADVEMRHTGDPMGFVDPFHLRQMVTDLVTNAVRYGAPPVIVSVTSAGVTSSIEVTDRGPGVPEDFVPHLYERFTRPGTGGGAHQPGSGFGLYIVGRLAHANGCRVTYSPRRPVGSRFRLEVPAVSA